MTVGQTTEISTRLGRRAIAPGRVFPIPPGLAGFENAHAFTLPPMVRGVPLPLLQSMHHPQLGFVVTNARIRPDALPLGLGHAEQRLLRLHRPEAPAIFVTMTTPPGAARKRHAQFERPHRHQLPEGERSSGSGLQGGLPFTEAPVPAAPGGTMRPAPGPAHLPPA